MHKSIVMWQWSRITESCFLLTLKKELYCKSECSNTPKSLFFHCRISASNFLQSHRYLTSCYSFKGRIHKPSGVLLFMWCGSVLKYAPFDSVLKILDQIPLNLPMQTVPLKYGLDWIGFFSCFFKVLLDCEDSFPPCPLQGTDVYMVTHTAFIHRVPYKKCKKQGPVQFL